MHIEYAQEILQYSRQQSIKWNWNITGEEDFLSQIIREKEFINFVINNFQGIAKDIMETIQSKIDNKYYKVTEAQKRCVRNEVLTRFTCEEIIENCFRKESNGKN